MNNNEFLEADKNNSLKSNIISIWCGLKNNFLSKDKNTIMHTIGDIISIIFVAVIIKMPIIFLKTILLDYLNTSEISYNIQYLISISIEVVYIIIALLYIYKRLKKCFGNKTQSI